MTWMPCSGLDEAEGLVWLPRLLQKARRFAEGRAAKRDLMGGYLYGDNDAIDKNLLRFLGTDDAAVLSVVEKEDSDAAAARTLVQRSARTLEERRMFSQQLRRKFFNFSVIEADEGRMPAGAKRAMLRFVYNYLMMPVFYSAFRRAECKRDALRAQIKIGRASDATSGQ